MARNDDDAAANADPGTGAHGHRDRGSLPDHLVVLPARAGRAARAAHRHRPARRPLGFTIVELLIVIATIALILTISIPSLSKARESARRGKCMANLRSIATAAAHYVDQCKILPALPEMSDEWGEDFSQLTCPSARLSDHGLYLFPVGLGASSFGPGTATTWFGRVQSQNPSKVAIVACMTTVPGQARHDRFWFGYMDGSSGIAR